MWSLLMVIAFGGLASTIKVPVADSEETAKDKIEIAERFNSKQNLYPSDGGQIISAGNFNSQHLEDIKVPIETPASFLLPPSGDALTYYQSPQPVEQSDWYPISPESTQNVPYQPLISNSPKAVEIVIGKQRLGKVLQGEFLPPTPSKILLPPIENAPNFYFTDSETQSLQSKFKQPTVLYPKKVVSGYNPVPIPIAQFAENFTKIPKAKPVKPLMPYPSIDGVFITPIDEKRKYLYEQMEQKRKLKKESQEQNQYLAPPKSTYESEENITPSEQDASESIHDHPENEVYATPVKHVRPVYVPANKGERTEFRMHGMNGPHSYQFGYDTGKGKNRQFRYEERDNDGHVRGHYGYMDKSGKLRVVKYDADPKLGFRADPPEVHE